MTSVTSPQQTDRRGMDEIPGPRGGQGVRLLVLGADPDAQELRDQAAAAGYELAQRYSARVSHVAYGPGIDPEDSRYTKIRDAGLNLLPLQKCAEALGLSAEAEADVAEAEAVGTGTEVGTEAVEADVAEDADAGEADVVEDAADAGPLEIPPLRPLVPLQSLQPEGSAPDEVVEVVEEATEVEVESGTADDDFAGASAADFVPGFSADVPELPLAAAVIGVDPWTGGVERKKDREDQEGGRGERGERGERRADEEVAEIPVVTIGQSKSKSQSKPHAQSQSQSQSKPHSQSQAESDSQSHSQSPSRSHSPSAVPRSNARHVLLSVAWALIPFATFGLLTPITFGYAAYRLRSRALVLTALGYTVAVIASFVLSAARPHSATPSDAAGALLTIALAGTWIGGTLHAVSIRTRVFAR
ncbi:hypothetical protein [Actinospica sp.]|uniref:hypothetical protein n=1 Tax=Actinospica sp. TaxID=1872142 RepID=UPI002CCAAC20|nr:hypothetical protein [Actinospica sp.]HWG27640.1 hypothetical protein [Actinospica sp.]